MDLDNILLEQYYEGLKIDLYSLDKKLGREMLMETWLGQSNQYHQDKILKILSFSLLLDIILNYALIPNYGYFGAALVVVFTQLFLLILYLKESSSF